MADLASEKEPLVQTSTAASSGKANIEMADADDSADFGTEAAGMSFGGAVEKWLGSSSCPDPLKNLWKEQGPALKPMASKAQQVLKANGKLVAMVHGVMCILYGGSFPNLSLILAFLSIYDTGSVVTNCKQLLGGTEAATPAKVMSVLASCCQFFTVCYAVWFSPFLAAFCVAIATEPYVTSSLESSPGIFAALHENCNKALPTTLTMNWFKFGLVMTIRVVLSLVSYLLLPGMFYAIFMGLYGMTLTCSTAGQGIQDLLNKNSVGDISMKTVALWAVVFAGTMWQMLCGYEASFLRWVVPVGFLVSYNGNISATFWKAQSVNSKDQ